MTTMERTWNLERPEQGSSDRPVEVNRRCEARFAFRLRAAAYHGEERLATDTAARQAFLAALHELADDQCLSVRFGRSSGSLANGLDWTIIGTTDGDNQEHVASAAKHLEDKIKVAFQSVPELDLVSHPVSFPASFSGRSHRLLPSGVALSPDGPSHPIGFAASEPGTAPCGCGEVVLPVPLAIDTEITSVVSAAARMPVGTCLEFRVRRLTLDEASRHAVESLLRNLRRGSLVGRRLLDNTRLELEALPRMQACWEFLLQSVLLKERICVVEVVALAGASVPSPQAYLGPVAWPQYEIDESGNSAHLRAGALDLRCVVAEPWLATRLVPTGADLSGLAFPAAFRAPLEQPKQAGIRLGTAGGLPVALGDKERGRHIYILGATGTGKTTLIGNCVKQAISAGEGVALLDPHGDLIADLIRWLPPSRANDVVLFDPTDGSRAPGLNILETRKLPSQIANSIIANEMVEVFRRLYKLNVNTGGPVFEQYARNAILLLLDNDIQPRLTLCELPAVFESSAFRKGLLKRCSNPYVVSFWREQAEAVTGDNSLRNMGPWITSKMNQFTHNPLIRLIVGQSSATVDFRRCMDEGKILLCNLTKGMLGAYDVKLLGMLITTGLLQAALSRAGTASDKRRPFSLFIDEFQAFVSDSVAQGLSEARKFNLRLVLANQHLAQLDSADPDAMMAAAVLGNAANLILFRLGPRDAMALEAYTKPLLMATDLQFLPDFHAAARILRDGRPLRPFVLRMDPPLAPRHSETAAAEVSQSITLARSAYTRAATDIEREIADRRSMFDGG